MIRECGFKYLFRVPFQLIFSNFKWFLSHPAVLMINKTQIDCFYFRSTYYEIEGSSTYFWSYQRYEMIQEFVDRPSVAPPFTLLWYCGEVVYAAFQRFLGLQLQRPGLDDFETEITDDPFCKGNGGHVLK